MYGDFSWIGHMEDHNGEMHVLFAMQHKEGLFIFILSSLVLINKRIKNNIFYSFSLLSY